MPTTAWHKGSGAGTSSSATALGHLRSVPTIRIHILGLDHGIARQKEAAWRLEAIACGCGVMEIYTLPGFLSWRLLHSNAALALLQLLSQWRHLNVLIDLRYS